MKNVDLGCYLFVSDGDLNDVLKSLIQKKIITPKLLQPRMQGLDLLGESVWPYEADKSYNLEYYVSNLH